MLLTRALLSSLVQAPINHVQLACVKPAASVRSEPGSNSHVKMIVPNPVHITHKESFGSFISSTQTSSISSPHSSNIPSAYPLPYLLSSITTELKRSNFSNRWHHRVGDVGYMMFFSPCQHKKLIFFKFFAHF